MVRLSMRNYALGASAASGGPISGFVSAECGLVAIVAWHNGTAWHYRARHGTARHRTASHDIARGAVLRFRSEMQRRSDLLLLLLLLLLLPPPSRSPGIKVLTVLGESTRRVIRQDTSQCSLLYWRRFT